MSRLGAALRRLLADDCLEAAIRIEDAQRARLLGLSLPERRTAERRKYDADVRIEAERRRAQRRAGGL